MAGLEDVFNSFTHRYMVINTGTNYEGLKKTFKDLPKPGYRDVSFIFDWDEGKAILFSKEAMRKKTFPIKSTDDISFLDKYKTDEGSFFYQIDKVKPRMESGVEQMYAIRNVWLAYTYYTKSRIKRMCINSNLFGTYQTIGTREFNIDKLLDN